MTYEKEIPEYAMLPARETEETLVIPVTKGAIYSPMQLTNITEKPKTVLTIEEDILVPDTKPDMKEILMIDGSARLTTSEFAPLSRAEDHIRLTGEIELQTLYLPEKEEHCDEILSVQSRIGFKEQWHMSPSPGSTLITECRIEKIEYMVINERKYRVKITLAIFAREYSDNKPEIFEGLANEEIQTRKEKIELSGIALRQKDSISIQESLMLKEECKIESILKQDISVTESYKQLTNEKLVINGFILVNVLYTLAACDEATQNDNVRQTTEKIEFTQFIPIRNVGEASGIAVRFDSDELRVKLVTDDEGCEQLSLEGELHTYIEIYTNTEKEIIVDAYHKEKDFVCEYKEEHGRTMIGSSVGEASVREIISTENAFGDIEKLLYTSAAVRSSESTAEPGKIITEGILGVKLICTARSEDEETECARIFSLKEELPFRVAATMPQAMGAEAVSSRVSVKDFRAEKINARQIEFNATIAVTAEVMREISFRLPMNPAFEESSAKPKTTRMAVYVAHSDDSLWSIAKHFKTTVDSIIQINKIEGEVQPGQKLLILK